MNFTAFDHKTAFATVGVVLNATTWSRGDGLSRAECSFGDILQWEKTDSRIFFSPSHTHARCGFRTYSHTAVVAHELNGVCENK